MLKCRLGSGDDLRADARRPGEGDRRDVAAADGSVVGLGLAHLDGGPLPAWHAGARIDVHLPSGTMRQYSLCGDPADLGTYRIAVRRVPGGTGSAELHALPVGSTLLISRPRNAFPIASVRGQRPTEVRFVAGGIGITPILPMVAAAHRLGFTALRALQPAAGGRRPSDHRRAGVRRGCARRRRRPNRVGRAVIGAAEFCGSCKVRVLSGAPEHQGRSFTDQDKDAGWFLPCVSRAAGDHLVLDL